jgi:hypothetical protein
MRISLSNLLSVILATVLLALMFLVSPTLSEVTPQPYDPWFDLTDDGIIDIDDVILVALRFGTTGTPINKTELLLELEARVSALEANYSVTNLKLAAGAIPYNVTHSTAVDSTTALSPVDMDRMSVTITLARNSMLIIMFSSEAKNPETTEKIAVQALVDGFEAYPGLIYFTPEDVTEYGVYSCNFYYLTGAGSHTVKIQWQVSGGKGYVWYRSLIVIALPA